jgi:hypothetical protein
MGDRDFSDGSLSDIAYLVQNSMQYEEGLTAALKTEMDRVASGQAPTLTEQDRDDIIDVINEDSSPTKVLKFISSQVANLQHMDERPEHLTKIIKRMKSMVRLQIFHPLSAQFYFSTNAHPSLAQQLTQLT